MRQFERGRLKKNAQNVLTKFPGLAISGRHNSTMITNAENSRPNCPPIGCLVSTFTVRINSKSFPGMYAAYRKGTYPYF